MIRMRFAQNSIADAERALRRCPQGLPSPRAFNSKRTGQGISRLRVSEKAFERLTRRRRIDGRFVSDLNEALLDHNLLVGLTGDAIGALKANAVKGWPRMTSDRLNDELRSLRRGTLDFDDLARELEDEGIESRRGR